ncbi:uncharacterized protein [Miscanthus floridulus]|uniref:uncharacterized protein n=1 Tax=Miscanthus floridulus TaxID=154761 RepID=UPI00345A5969
MADTTGTSWSDIPLELAGLVLCHLPAHVDRIRFATREVPLPSPLPLLALPDSTVYSLPGSEPLRFPGCTAYADACGNWLAFSTEDGCFLGDPFSNATVTLPQLFRVRAPRRHGVSETRVSWVEMEDAPEKLTIYKLRRCSRFVRVSPEEMPGDRIIFLGKDDEDHDWYEEGGSACDSCKVYDMKDGTVSPFVPSVHWEHGSVPATWLFPLV